MLMSDAVYKVLWVDDQKEIVQGYQVLAALRNIQLIHFESWTDALPTLEKDFAELTAIVLDANCKWKTSDMELSEGFLGDVLSDLQKMFGDRHREIPWYILSAGTMTNFNVITNVIINRDRREKEAYWGKALYLKTDFEDQGIENPLFDSIRKVGETQSNNIVLYRHKEAFQYLGDHSFIDESARRIMLKALAVLYYPEENLNYEFAGNPIRKVVEYLFKAAYRCGILTDDFFDDRGNLRIWNCMEYLCGRDVDLSSNKDKSRVVRYGKRGNKPDYSDYDSVLPTSCYYSFRGLLNYVNVDSHTIGEVGDAPYRVNADTKDLFCGFVLQLCYYIVCLGGFLSNHHDKEANKAQMNCQVKNKNTAPAPSKTSSIEFIRKETTDSIIGHDFTVLEGKHGKYAGVCKIGQGIQVGIMARIRIDAVEPNTGKDKKEYPFIATTITVL